MKYIINNEQNKLTIKEFVIKYTAISKKQLAKIKRLNDGILLNNEHATVRAILHTGDMLSLATEFESKTSDGIEAVNLPLDIIYEDCYYIAVNKPAFTPTHPSHNHHYDTLANALAYKYKERGIPFVFRAVNRLDKNTSGIVIFAKSAEAANSFSKLQQKGLVIKEYLALVNKMTSEQGKIEGYIKRREKSIIYREFSLKKNTDGAQYSLSEYKRLAYSSNASLLKLRIYTGRTHQIRLHLQSIGHYVIGDDLYGKSNGEQRQMLHCYEMKFVHPFINKEIQIKAELPSDFITAAEKRGIKYEL